MGWKLDVSIDEPFADRVDETWLRRVAEHVLKIEKVDLKAELGLLITGDETMTDLNRTYRDIDGTTDVLSFAFQEDKEFPAHPEGVTQLGEVIVSMPQAERQAAEKIHSLDEELAVLVIHGVLHLLGYDHQTDEDEDRMMAREQEALAQLQAEKQ